MRAAAATPAVRAPSRPRDCACEVASRRVVAAAALDALVQERTAGNATALAASLGATFDRRRPRPTAAIRRLAVTRRASEPSASRVVTTPMWRPPSTRCWPSHRRPDALAAHWRCSADRAPLSRDAALAARDPTSATPGKAFLDRRPLMPAVQTTYSATQSPAYLGMVANGEWVTNVISRIVDPASAVAVNFGDAVLQGASEQLVVSANGGDRRGPWHRGARHHAAARQQRPVPRHQLAARDHQGRRLGQCRGGREPRAGRLRHRRRAC